MRNTVLLLLLSLNLLGASSCNSTLENKCQQAVANASTLQADAAYVRYATENFPARSQALCPLIQESMLPRLASLSSLSNEAAMNLFSKSVRRCVATKKEYRCYGGAQMGQMDVCPYTEVCTKYEVIARRRFDGYDLAVGVREMSLDIYESLRIACKNYGSSPSTANRVFLESTQKIATQLEESGTALLTKAGCKVDPSDSTHIAQTN
jgi:hypothetical protein